MQTKTEQMIQQMAGNSDIGRVLAKLELTEIQAVNLLLARAGRRIRAARRRLSRIHMDVLACRYSPFAVQKICELIGHGKEEMRLKGALSLLDIARLGKAEAKRMRKEKALPAPTAEDLELFGILAKVMNPPQVDLEQDGLEVVGPEGELPALPEGDSRKGVDNGVDSK